MLTMTDTRVRDDALSRPYGPTAGHSHQSSPMTGIEENPRLAVMKGVRPSFQADRDLSKEPQAISTSAARAQRDENVHITNNRKLDHLPPRASSLNHEDITLKSRRASIGFEQLNSLQSAAVATPGRSPIALQIESTVRSVTIARRTTAPSARKNEDLVNSKASSCKRSWHSLGSVSGATQVAPLRRRACSLRPDYPGETRDSVGSNGLHPYPISRLEPTALLMSSPASVLAGAPSPSPTSRRARPMNGISHPPPVQTVPAVDRKSSSSPSSFNFAIASFDELEAIRKSVRAYTLLPKHARPRNCEPALAIYSLTGYVLVSPVDSLSSSSMSSSLPNGTNLGVLDSPSIKTRADKADILQQLGGDDAFRELDANKLRDATFALEATQCRPEKDRGFYRYIHVPTGSVVTPELYEERYMTMLATMLAPKAEYWSRYFQGLKREECAQMVASRLHIPATQSPSGRNALGRLPSKSPESSFLPVGSQGETSSDPEIAAAELELHEKIDSALREYSHKVLVIQDRRRRVPRQSRHK